MGTLRDPSLISVVSIADHDHIFFLFGDPEGSPSKTTVEILLCEVYGDN